MATMPLGWRHIRIVAVASLGQMAGTAVATMVSVMIPMIQLVSHPELSSWMQGLLGAMDLIGIAIGSVVIGRMSDRWGYLLFFRLCPAVVCLSALAAVVWPSVAVTLVCLFVMGFAIGGEYSLDSDYISELMPDRWKSMMVGFAKAASALGNILVAGVCFLLVRHWDNASDWPRLMWLMAALSGVMVLVRIRFAGSPGWLLAHGEIAKASEAVRYFLGDNVVLSPAALAAATARKSAMASAKEVPATQQGRGGSLRGFMRLNWRKVILSGIPWACEGLGVYGIGVFLPVLVLALGIGHTSAGAGGIEGVASSVLVTFWISCIMLPGFLLGLWLLRRMWLIHMLAWGFWLSAASLVMLLLGYALHWPAWISIVSFMAFELALNAGPHLVTYILPPEIYPVGVRSQGSGIAASLGKIGAVAAVFLIPVILKIGGVASVLVVSAAVMLAGGIVARLFGSSVPRPET